MRKQIQFLQELMYLYSSISLSKFPKLRQQVKYETLKIQFNQTMTIIKMKRKTWKKIHGQ
jgi:hypothetical protein